MTVRLFVARSDERKLPLGPRYGNVQQIGIIREGGNLIVDGRQDDGLLFPSLKLVDRGHVNTSAQLAVERIDLLVVGDNADLSRLAGKWQAAPRRIDSISRGLNAHRVMPGAVTTP